MTDEIEIRLHFFHLLEILLSFPLPTRVAQYGTTSHMQALSTWNGLVQMGMCCNYKTHIRLKDLIEE